jgi:hypothetical protein
MLIGGVWNTSRFSHTFTTTLGAARRLETATCSCGSKDNGFEFIRNAEDFKVAI